MHFQKSLMSSPSFLNLFNFLWVMGGILIFGRISGWRIDLFTLCMRNWVADGLSHFDWGFVIYLLIRNQDIMALLSLIEESEIS